MLFAESVEKVIDYAKSIGFNIIMRNDLDDYFKGDMDGINIYYSDMDEDDVLFNLLHMIGHSIQWNVSDELRNLGSQLYLNPDSELLKKLQKYEWEANCYALYILHKIGITQLDEWLFNKYIEDMFYLTHFYMTGERAKYITPISLKYSFTDPLIEKEVPAFTPVKNEITRNGIVIDFNGSKKD